MTGANPGYESHYPRLVAASIPIIQNVALTLANTEYSYPCVQGAKILTIKTRDPKHTLRLAWKAGETATNYISWSRGIYWVNLLGDTALTMFLRSPDSNCVVEIEYWV
jgi:hypothetical protein